MGSRCKWVLLNTKHTKGEMVDAQVTELENFWWWRKADKYTWIKKKKKVFIRVRKGWIKKLDFAVLKRYCFVLWRILMYKIARK